VRRDLSMYANWPAQVSVMVSEVKMKNKTVTEPDERRLFSPGGRMFDVKVIYHRTA